MTTPVAQGYNISPTSLVVTTQPIPKRDGYFSSPAIAIAVVAADLNADSGSTWNARYRGAHGEFHGASTIVASNTYLTGGGGSGGKAFTLNSGTVLDTWVDYTTGAGCTGLLFTNGAIGAPTVQVTQTTADTDFLHQSFVIKRGFPSGSYAELANAYTRIEFAYGATKTYSLLMKYSYPFQLQYTTDSGTHWDTVQESTNLGNVEEYFGRAEEIRISILPDRAQNTMVMHILGSYLKHCADISPALPTTGLIRVTHSCGWGAVAIYPLSYSTATVTSSRVDLSQASSNLGSAYIVMNGLVRDPNVTTSASISNVAGKMAYTVTANNSDTNKPPRITDATLIVPPIISATVSGGINPTTINTLLTMLVEETEILDDAKRMVYTSANVTANNWKGQYTGAYRNQAIDITCTNMGFTGKRLTGIAGVGGDGLELLRNDPTRTLTIPCTDKRVVMGADPNQPVPIGYRLILDGWGLYPAVGFLCLLGNIDVSRFSSDTRLTGPYGPQGTSYTAGPILASGTGNNPRFSFGPETSPWTALQTLIMDQGQPATFGGTTINVPYYFGFDPNGMFLFEPYDPRSVAASVCYEGDPNGGYFLSHQTAGAGLWANLPILPICGGVLSVTNNCNQERSEINFQGKNPLTQKLEQVHIPSSARVQEDIGFRSAWVERNARWFGQYLIDVATAGITQCSLPVQKVTIPTVFHPGVHITQTCYVYDAIAIGPNPIKCYITGGQHRYGITGTQTIGTSVIQARNVLNPA